MAGRIDRDLDRTIAQGSAVYAQQLAKELTGAEERFSPRFEAAMEGMIARQSAKKAAGGVKRQLRAAAVVLVCFGVLGVGAMRVEAIRLPLLELLVGERESYTEVAFRRWRITAPSGGRSRTTCPPTCRRGTSWRAWRRTSGSSTPPMGAPGGKGCC